MKSKDIQKTGNSLVEELYGNLTKKLFQFEEKKSHLTSSLLMQSSIHASAFLLQFCLARLLAMLKEEYREEEYENFMKDFKSEVFEGAKKMEIGFSEFVEVLKNSEGKS